jgi:hypothetical protein
VEVLLFTRTLKAKWKVGKDRTRGPRLDDDHSGKGGASRVPRGDPPRPDYPWQSLIGGAAAVVHCRSLFGPGHIGVVHERLGDF